MIINGQKLLAARPVTPMASRKISDMGYSFGLTECGYDIRLKHSVWMCLGRRFVLASSFEYFNMPYNLMGRVLNKSSWARRGIDASMTTNIEPGWKGWLTIELNYRKAMPIFIPAGVGIAQVIFEDIAELAQYDGKYQNQANRPVPAIHA